MEERHTQTPEEEKRPGRYRFYDKLKLRVSLKTMDVIIYATVALILLAVIIGMLI